MNRTKKGSILFYFFQGGLLLLTLLCLSAASLAIVSYKEAIQIFGQVSGTVNTSDNSNESRFTLDGVANCAIDTAGNIFIADYANNRVLRYDASGLPPTDTGADLVFGQTSMDATAGESGVGRLLHPIDLTFDRFGALWVVDGDSDRVLRYDPSSDGITDTTPDLVVYTYSEPKALAFDMNDSLWVSCAGSTSAILVYGANEAGQVTDTIPDVILWGPGPSTTFSGNDIAFDQHGSLYIAEQTKNRVLRIPGIGINPHADTDPDLILGQADLSGSSTDSGAHGLNGPRALAFDSRENLYVSDAGNNRILRFKPRDTDGLLHDTEAYDVIGQTAFDTTISNGGGLSASSLSSPWGLTFDSKGDLYISDAGNNRLLVLKVDPPDVSLMNEASLCFVSSAVFGESSDQTRVLRVLRDRFLLEGASGRFLVGLYYAYGPFIANALEGHGAVVWAIRVLLVPLVGLGNLIFQIGSLGAFFLIAFVAVAPGLVRSIRWTA